MGGFTVVNASAGGAFLVATGRPVLQAGRLVAAAADAVATIRETDGSGRTLMKLSAAAGTADESLLSAQYAGQVHVTITGAGAVLLLYQA